MATSIPSVIYTENLKSTALPIQKPLRIVRDNVRSWSELFSLCLNSSQSTSSELALHCAEELLRYVNIDSNRLMRLQSIANRHTMIWTVDLDDHSTYCVARIKHSLFAVDIRIDKCTDQLEQVCLVDQSSRTNCQPMLDCLKAYDYDMFEKHLLGFVALRNGGSVLFEAERILLDASCTAKNKTAKTVYWDIFAEPLGHVCSRQGGIGPKFFYFLSPDIFLKHCIMRQQNLDSALEQYGYYLNLNIYDGHLHIELYPPLPIQQTAFKDFSGIYESTTTKCVDYRLLDCDDSTVIKVYKPEFKLIKSISLQSINEITHIIKLLRMQAFIFHLLDISDLPKWDTTLSTLNSRYIKVCTNKDASLNIYLPPTNSTFPHVRLRFNGESISIDDPDNEKLEFVFRKAPSTISLLHILSRRCKFTIKEACEDVIMEDDTFIQNDNEGCLNDVFDSVIERFTRPVQLDEPLEPLEPLEPFGPLEPSESTSQRPQTPDVTETVKSEEIDVIVPILPKIKIKPLISPPRMTVITSDVSEQSNEQKKKKKPRKLKAEQPPDVIKSQLVSKKVEPLRIKISGLNPLNPTGKRRGPVPNQTGPKKKVGRKKLTDIKKAQESIQSELLAVNSKEIKEEKQVDCLAMLNKSKSILSTYKIPRKPKETPANSQWIPTPQPPPQSIQRFCSQNNLSDPLPPSPHRFPMLDRSSSTSPQIAAPNKRYFAQQTDNGLNRHSAFPTNINRPMLDLRLRQTRYQSPTNINRPLLDPRLPQTRYRIPRPSNEFRYG